MALPHLELPQVDNPEEPDVVVQRSLGVGLARAGGVLDVSGLVWEC